MKTTVYWLCDAPRVWYMSVKEVLLKAGAEKVCLITQIFFWDRTGNVQGLIYCHFDYFIWVGTNDFENTIIQKAKESFVTSPEELQSFKYLGLNIVQKNYSTNIDELQEAAIESKMKMSKEAQLTTGETWQLRGLAGQLNWTSSQMPPDMSLVHVKLALQLKI